MEKDKLPFITQWFSFEDRECVERSVDTLRELKVTELRTLFSWADWLRPGGPEWFDWFISKLSEVENLRLLPCLFYTPPHLAMKDIDGNAQTSYPPLNTSTFAEFTEEVIKKYGEHFDWIQLWNEPNWKPYWDDILDPDWSIQVDMLRQASIVAKNNKKKISLGGVAPLEFSWFTRLEEKGLLKHLDAVSFHYAPSWPLQHRRWFPLETELHTFRALLDGLERNNIEIWIDEVGLSTKTPFNENEEELEQEQIRFFEAVRTLPTDRVYWYCIIDQHPQTPTDDMLNTHKEIDITAYHFGLLKIDGIKKPLFEHWKKLAEEKNHP